MINTMDDQSPHPSVVCAIPKWIAAAALGNMASRHNPIPSPALMGRCLYFKKGRIALKKRIATAEELQRKGNKTR